MEVTEQGDTSPSSEGKDLLPRLIPIVDEIEAQTSFVLDRDAEPVGAELLNGAENQLGKLALIGTLGERKAVLTISAFKDQFEGVEAIENFSKQNTCDTFRGPHLVHIPWSDDHGFEAVAVEDFERNEEIGELEVSPVVTIPASITQMRVYFNIYEEYKENPIENPWIEKPTGDAGKVVERRLEQWKDFSHTAHTENSHWHASDKALVDRAEKFVLKGYANCDLTFQNGEFSPHNLAWADNDVVLISHEEWGWQPPFADLAHAYHQHMIDLTEVDGVTEDILEEQAQMWVDGIREQTSTPDNRRSWKLATITESIHTLHTLALKRESNSHTNTTQSLINRTRKNLISLLFSDSSVENT